MDGSPSSIIMLGLGNGTFAGSPSLVLTLGLGVGEADTSLAIDPTCSRRLPPRAHDIRLPKRAHDIRVSLR